ncbi:MAG: RluA family pseudouridine synthase [Phycisphaerales bacterium]|nr:MAG: RluA family pseudouridine synthase [Phycisphaerales bacterium]
MSDAADPLSGLPPVLHRDERIIVLDKPAGLLSVPGIGPEKADCLAKRVAEAFEGARIVHRLDRDTSGVIVMAFDAEAHRELSRQFHDREVEKVYIAVVAGVVNNDAGVVDLPMRKDLEDPPRQVIDHVHGRPAITEWRVIKRQSDRTRLELRPLTGRSHQLRLHLKEMGHPILGDDLYAPPEVLAMADRLLLHAYSLTIVHPTTAELMTFKSPTPF